MSERIGREELLGMLLQGLPELVVNAATRHPDDRAELRRLRDELALLSFGEAIEPPKRLRERLLATRPRPRRPEHPVLAVLDMLNDHLRPGCPLEVPRAREIVPALRKRLEEARARKIPIVYLCDSHEEGDPDLAIWPRHALAGSEGAQVWPALAPEPGDHVVTKPTYSAFARSELGPLLDRLGADEIILTGCATEIGLMATATDALQRGFVVTVPRDSQAGTSEMGEAATLLTLSIMPPYDPRYLRAR